MCAAIVNSVDDDISEMWNRLDEKYGNPAKGARVNLTLQIGWLEERSQVKSVLTAIGKKNLSFSNNLRASGLFLVINLKKEYLRQLWK